LAFFAVGNIRNFEIEITPLSVYMSVNDPLSMGAKKGWPVKSGLIAKVRSEQRIYYIGKK